MNKDEKNYQALMGKYKDTRGSRGPEANKYLKAALELKKKGTIRKEVILACSYL